MRARTSSLMCLLLVVIRILLPPLLTPADAVTWLGGVNLIGWCKEKGGDRVSLQGTTAYHWHCMASDGREIFMNVFEACKSTYHDPNAVDWLGNYFNPYSWACFTNARQLRSIDFAGYCKSQGYRDVDVAGPTAYHIYCLKASRERVEVSPNAECTTGLTPTKACQWTWRNSGVAARLPDYNNPHSWQCWL